MGFDWGSALEGGVEGAGSTAGTGNPYVIAGAALLNGVLKGFSGKKKSAEEDPSASKSNGFMDLIPNGGGGGAGGGGYAGIIQQVLGQMGGGGLLGGGGAEPEPQPKVIQGQPASINQAPLLGFNPQMSVLEKLRAATAARRGY